MVSNNYLGRTWGSLNDEETHELIMKARPMDIISGNKMRKDGKCVIEFDGLKLCILGAVSFISDEDGVSMFEIAINNDEKLVNPEIDFDNIGISKNQYECNYLNALIEFKHSMRESVTRMCLKGAFADPLYKFTIGFGGDSISMFSHLEMYVRIDRIIDEEIKNVQKVVKPNIL